MLDRFLSTKLYLPRLRPDLVARPRLLGRLDATVEGGVAVLAAPAGAGKTVLAAQWLHGLRAGARPPAVAWIALDAADNDAGRFWTVAVAALDAAAPSVAPGAGALVRGTPAREAETVLTALLNGLAAHDGAIVIALDHFNAISEPALLDAVAFVLDNLPPNVRVVVTSRALPGLPAERWRVDGRLTELTEADLQFTLDEARTFLVDRAGLAASDAQVVRLVERTEGWIAGLTLAARAARERGLDAAIDSFDGSHRYVGDYLASEVLAVLSDDVRRFLLDTAALDRLCGPLCDAVTLGEAGSGQAFLEQLDADNLFVVALDDHREWFRYHRLFADALRTQQAAARPAAEVVALHRRAAGWYRAHGYVARAVRHCLDAGDEDDAVALILAAADDAWTKGRAATLQSWIEALSAAARDREPRLALYLALAHVLNGQSLEAVDPLLAPLPEALADAPDSWRGRLAVVRGTVHGVRGQSDSAAAEAAAAQRLLDPDDLPWRGLAALDLGLAELSRGDEAAAARAFAEARTLGVRADNPYATLAATVNLARAYHLDGALHAAAAAYREALSCADAHGLHRLPLTGLAHVGLGDILREWNACDEAAGPIAAGLALAEGRHVHVRVAVAGHLAQAQLCVATARPSDAIAALDAAEAVALRHDRPEYLAEVGHVRALVGLQLNDPGPALRWLADAADHDGATHAWGRPTASDADRLLRARLALFLGDPTAASDHLAAVEAQLSARPGQLAARVTLAALTARLRFDTTDRDGAAAAMRRALRLAQPERFIRLFADDGPAIAPLVELARSAPDDGAPGAEAIDAYVAELLEAIGAPLRSDGDGAAGDGRASTGPAPDRLAAANGALAEPLSSRELEVLRAIAAGATNQEIADALVIALSTVKTHVNNIFGKLGVRSRTQAVAQARQIGLL